jgi:hypothetical protein
VNQPDNEPVEINPFQLFPNQGIEAFVDRDFSPVPEPVDAGQAVHPTELPDPPPGVAKAADLEGSVATLNDSEENAPVESLEEIVEAMQEKPDDPTLPPATRKTKTSLKAAADSVPE